LAIPYFLIDGNETATALENLYRIGPPGVRDWFLRFAPPIPPHFSHPFSGKTLTPLPSLGYGKSAGFSSFFFPIVCAQSDPGS